MSLPTLPAEAARTLLLEGGGLLEDPGGRCGPARVRKRIQRLGFVQVDSINVLERAHHQTLQSRLDGYRREHLQRLLEKDRALFEHWTHDASIIPLEWFPYWRHRFAAVQRSPRFERWMTRKLGPDADRVIRRVARRIDREGPLMTRDFEDHREGPRTGWWDWKPERAALELLWRIGRISISGRREFHKVYDRTDRVFPGALSGRRPSAAAHRDWACREALKRLGVATPLEIARFFEAIPVAEARAWCQRAARRGACIAVEVAAEDGTDPRPAYALPDWERRVRRAPSPPDRMRILSPFDPVLRDRERAKRRFGFEFRIECFVPAAKRRHGYYVTPLLDGDRLVGRLDPRFDRKRGVLSVQRVFWEDGIRETRERGRRLDEALDRFARQIGATSFERPRS